MNLLVLLQLPSWSRINGESSLWPSNVELFNRAFSTIEFSWYSENPLEPLKVFWTVEFYLFLIWSLILIPMDDWKSSNRLWLSTVLFLLINRSSFLILFLESSLFWSWRILSIRCSQVFLSILRILSVTRPSTFRFGRLLIKFQYLLLMCYDRNARSGFLFA